MIQLTHVCDTYRMTATGEGISKVMQVNLTDVRCLALPMSNQSTVQNGWDWGQGYDVYFNSGVDIKKGDKLQVGSLTLIVQGIKDYSNTPPVSHLQAACQREDS